MTTKILLIEDNPGDVKLTAELIEDLGLPVEISAIGDGQQALAFVRRCQNGEEDVPDVVLLDINLGRGSGMDVLRAARAHERTRGIFIAVYSGSSSPLDMKKAEQLGADAYLLKPMTIDEIDRMSATMRTIVEGRAR
jgi:CheY-like chemotaxis protein